MAVVWQAVIFHCRTQSALIPLNFVPGTRTWVTHDHALPRETERIRTPRRAGAACGLGGACQDRDPPQVRGALPRPDPSRAQRWRRVPPRGRGEPRAPPPPSRRQGGGGRVDLVLIGVLVWHQPPTHAPGQLAQPLLA
eukprot:gene16089-biopygen5238